MRVTLPKARYHGKVNKYFIAIFLLLAGSAKASPEIWLESYGPLSSSARDSTENTAYFFGGVLKKSEEEAYLKQIAGGADPSTLTGPAQIYFAEGTEGSKLEPKPALSQRGYHLDDPAAFRPPNSSTISLFFTRGENKIAGACRKKKAPVDTCAEYLLNREIGLATSEDNGKSFTFQRIVAGPKDSGDGTGPGQPTVIFTGSEIWLYYTTGRQNLMQENIFRLRLTIDGSKRLAPPEEVRIKNFTSGTALENIQVVRLKCDAGGKFVVTMVANTRWRNAIPFYVSTDGLNFRRASESVVHYENKSIASPTQLPGPASLQECQAGDLAGVPSVRDLLWTEEVSPGNWRLKRQKLPVVF